VFAGTVLILRLNGTVEPAKVVLVVDKLATEYSELVEFANEIVVSLPTKEDDARPGVLESYSELPVDTACWVVLVISVDVVSLTIDISVEEANIVTNGISLLVTEEVIDMFGCKVICW